MSGDTNTQETPAPKFNWSSLLEVLVGIGKNNKQYRMLVVKKDIAFDRSLVTKAMKEGVPIKDIRNATGPEWGDDDLPEAPAE
jgi:hypothetical protein